MGIYVGLNDSSKEISGIYLGSENSVKEVSEGYISDADGNMKEIYSSVEPGQQVFTTSGTFTVPDKVKYVDIFLVGGGGKGGCCLYEERHNTSATNNTYWTYYCGGAGGGGGFTKTVKKIPVIQGEQYSIVVGSGSTYNYWGIKYSGSASTAFGYEAKGGDNGWGSHGNRGSNGGSGGGYSSIYDSQDGDDGRWMKCYNYGGNGGSDGSRGYGWSATSTTDSLSGGGSQGTTTRAFGESSGTLYAGGGGGAGYDGVDYSGKGGSGGGGNGGSCIGTEGSGGGGGGACEDSTYDIAEARSYYGLWHKSKYGGDGGSGIVIIRWGY